MSLSPHLSWANSRSARLWLLRTIQAAMVLRQAWKAGAPAYRPAEIGGERVCTVMSLLPI
jgi:hypothetical protein